MQSIIVFILLIGFTDGVILCPDKCRCHEKRDFVVYCFSKGYTNLTRNISRDVTVIQFPFNNIKRISDRMFTSFTKLKHIVISHNQIEAVSPNAFDGLVHLIRIDLSENRITEFPWETFQATPNLSLLYLNNNFIKNIPTDNEVRSLTRLQSLRIHENNFICSCDVLPFAKWLQENDRKTKERNSFVTVPNDKNLTCSTTLNWKTVKIFDLLTTGFKYKDECTLPILELISMSSIDSVNALSRPVRSITPDYNMSLDFNMEDPGNLLSMTSLPKMNNQKRKSFTQVWFLDSSKEIVFSVVEKMNMKIICDVTNKHLFTKTKGYLLKMMVVGKDKSEINLHQVRNWTSIHEITIHRVEKNIHDGYRIICAAENIAGSIASVARIKVVQISDTPTTKNLVKLTMSTPTEKQRKTTLLSAMNTNTMAENLHTVTQTPDTVSKPFHNSSCRKNYNDDVIILKPIQHSRNQTEYKYSYDGYMNISLTDDTKEEYIILKISASTSNIGLIYICHSNNNIPRQWTMVKRGTEMFSLIPFYKKSGSVCILSSHFKREVCGTFPPFEKKQKSMMFMTIVGFSFLSIVICIMSFCALHHVYFYGISIRFRNNRKRFSHGPPREFVPVDNVEGESFSLLEISELTGGFRTQSTTPDFSYEPSQYTPDAAPELDEFEDTNT